MTGLWRRGGGRGGGRPVQVTVLGQGLCATASGMCVAFVWASRVCGMFIGGVRGGEGMCGCLSVPVCVCGGGGRACVCVCACVCGGERACVCVCVCVCAACVWGGERSVSVCAMCVGRREGGRCLPVSVPVCVFSMVWLVWLCGGRVPAWLCACVCARVVVVRCWQVCVKKWSVGSVG